jgi:hypothetical protein
MSETKEAYVTRQKGNIETWKVEIEKFQEKANRAIGKKVDKYKKHIEELTALRGGLADIVATIEKSAETDWEGLKAGSEKVFKSLDKSYKSAKAFFN